VARDLHTKSAGEENMQHTATNTPNASMPPAGLSTAGDRRSSPPQPAVCASCNGGAGDLTFGDDPDGFVLCGECRSPLFYCDLGGQG
jgi:hypothetical protein